MTAFPGLEAISPIDGRYHHQTKVLSGYFSESALIKYRVRVEVEYFLALCAIQLPQLSDIPEAQQVLIREKLTHLTAEDVEAVKTLEQTTNHDVKAVEYYLRNAFDAHGLENYKEFIHFGLTSQDINNTAIPMALKECCEEQVYPAIANLIGKLRELAESWKHIPMLARTHGQPASPTRLGKELYVFVERLENQFNLLLEVPFTGKFGGATGNFNAHAVAYPDIDWLVFGDRFLQEYLGINRQRTTTQIEHYDHLAAWCDGMKRINNILVDLSRDIWSYISLEYFRQQIKANEVGSSAMPHKVNPIDFENAEGNLMLANALFEFLAGKLPVSRLQRDLTDSTVIRNLGVPVAHTWISFRSIQRGLDKLLLNEDKIRKDLADHYVVVAEAIQTILRRENYPHPYETLKQLTRLNDIPDASTIRQFVDGLNISDEVKQEILAITPENYTGILTF